MAETGHMVSKLPVPIYRDGSVGAVSAHFEADGKSLWLQTSEELLDVQRWIGLHGADVAAPVLAVVLAWVLWKGNRARSRPQEPGKAHCPKCSYKMLPPVVKRGERERFEAAAGTICPECGLDLVKRRPVEGEAFLSRMWVVMGIGGVVIAACMGILAATLAWGAAPGASGPSWPLRSMNAWVPGWRITRRAGDWPPLQELKVARWNVRSGEMELAAAERLRPQSLVKVSADRRWMGVGETDGAGRTWVAVVDLRNGRVQRREIKGGLRAPWVGAEVLCFGGGGSAMYVGVTETRPTGIGTKSSLWKYDVATLEGVRLDERAAQVQTGMVWPHVVYRVREDEQGGLRWAHVTALTSQTSRTAVEAEVVWNEGDEVRTTTVDVPTGATWGWFEFAEDGRAFELRLQTPTGVAIRVDLGSGDVGMVPWMEPARYVSLNGRYEAKVQASGVVEVVERGSSSGARWSFPGTAGTYVLAVSDDGGRVAVMNATGGQVGVEVWEGP